uniref:DOCKER domain-containing protein n=1 Tax=Ascaris lumbricoides TaxID=6252 RepID=A0A0M3HUZ5_ASCLU
MHNGVFIKFPDLNTNESVPRWIQAHPNKVRQLDNAFILVRQSATLSTFPAEGNVFMSNAEPIEKEIDSSNAKYKFLYDQLWRQFNQLQLQVCRRERPVTKIAQPYTNPALISRLLFERDTSLQRMLVRYTSVSVYSDKRANCPLRSSSGPTMP